MATGTVAAWADSAWRRGWPEALLGVLAVAVFLGCLGSVELWGKREQRGAAEAIDTIDHYHWRVAEIQGRPRLEKPPLPRWTMAALMLVTGRRDEGIVRLPAAASALVTVALVYFLGRQIGGRPVGLAAGLILCSLGFFVGEMRQATNDGPLAMFTTLAVWAAFRRLGDGDDGPLVSRGSGGPPEARFPNRERTPGARAWGLTLYGAMGLGFLTKGPIILMVVLVAIVPYLALSGRLATGLRRLADGWGFLLLTAMATSWPFAVLLDDPTALHVWLTEVSEKTGVWHVLSHRPHTPLAASWLGMMLPWSVIAPVAAVLPFLVERGARPLAGSVELSREVWPSRTWSSPVWLTWWWAIGNLAHFCLWAIAKPNYYLPCMPGAALLLGTAWVRLGIRARGHGRAAEASRAILQAQWVFLFVAAGVAPLVARSWLPRDLWPWSAALAAVLALAVVSSAYAWRRGADALGLAPIAAAVALGVLVVYGILAPAENARRSHRGLAQTIRRLVPEGVRALRFYNEIDEGLWFYLTGLDLVPVPETQPRYNSSYDLADAYRSRPLLGATLKDLDDRRRDQDRLALLRWLDRDEPTGRYLLIRAKLYDQFLPELSARVTPLFRETGLPRNELVLLQVKDQILRSAATPAAPTRR